MLAYVLNHLGQTEDLTILERGYFCRVNDMIGRVLKECAELREIVESDRESALGYNTAQLLRSLTETAWENVD